MKARGASPFPPAPALLSRAVWYTLDHAGPVLALGLCGSVPPAALFLVFLRESLEGFLVPGATVAALRPLAFVLAALSFVRFPLRLALARYMALERGGLDPWPACGRALGFALVHAPTALLYGALSTLGWLLGSLLVLPLLLTLQAGLARQLFAAGELSAWEAWSEAGRVPVGGLGWRLLGLVQVVYLWIFLVVWTAPGTALRLAEWLLRADVAALVELFGMGSAAWLAAAVTLALVFCELLWSVAFGLLAGEWERLSQGADLAARLAAVEQRAASAEAFS